MTAMSSPSTAAAASSSGGRPLPGRLRLGVPVLLVALLLLLAPMSSARADEEAPLEFSTDGVTWTSTLEGALFDSDLVLVPGGSASTTLHLRSNAPGPGVLDVAITNVEVSSEQAARAFELSTVLDPESAVTRTHVGLPLTPLAEFGERTRVGPPLEIAPGESAMFTLTIHLAADLGGTEAQNSTVGLDLSILFEDANAAGGDAQGGEQSWPEEQVIPAFPEGEQDAPSERPEHPVAQVPAGQDPTAEGPGPVTTVRDLLAVTGISRGLIYTASGLILLGALFVLLGRRRRDESEQ